MDIKSAGAEWRAVRIQKAIRLASMICDVSEDQLSILINEIEDDRGVLVIYWENQPTDTQRRAFSKSWAECSESEDRVCHKVGKGAF